MTRIAFRPLLAAVALLVSITAAPSASHLLSNQDLSDLSSSDVIPPSSAIASGSTQVIPQQNVQIGSETGVYPVTGVYPSLIYQPAVQLYNPLVNNYQSSDPYDPFNNGGNGFDSSYPGDTPLGVNPDPASLINKRQVSVGPNAQSGGVVGTPSDVSTNTLIEPIVTIQPHAFQPVPVPVSQPYTVPVPVGVSVPGYKRCLEGLYDDCHYGCKWGDDSDCGNDCDCGGYSDCDYGGCNDYEGCGGCDCGGCGNCGGYGDCDEYDDCDRYNGCGGLGDWGTDRSWKDGFGWGDNCDW
ncbi:hypothetical protein BGZ46_005936 [Entomortierella lignicola]|nr:hypothetical protein BGZ46_005936 [Entomortierella lignicola]